MEEVEERIKDRKIWKAVYAVFPNYPEVPWEEQEMMMLEFHKWYDTFVEVGLIDG